MANIFNPYNNYPSTQQYQPWQQSQTNFQQQQLYQNQNAFQSQTPSQYTQAVVQVSCCCPASSGTAITFVYPAAGTQSDAQVIVQRVK